MHGTQALGEAGATAVEYALMLALLFMAILAGVSLLGTNLNAAFANAASLI